MQKIQVADISSKPTSKGGTFTIITDDKGGKFSGFDIGLANLTKGSVIEAEIFVEGKYTNIVKDSWKVLESTPSIPPQVREPFKADPLKQASIERQVALKVAADLCIAGKIELKDICPVAYYFNRFLDNMMKFSDTQVIEAMKLSPLKYKEVAIPPEHDKSATALTISAKQKELKALMTAQKLDAGFVIGVCKRLGLPLKSDLMTEEQLDTLIKELSTLPSGVNINSEIFQKE